jgi:hypothetical protein
MTRHKPRRGEIAETGIVKSIAPLRGIPPCFDFSSKERNSPTHASGCDSPVGVRHFARVGWPVH